MGVEIGAQRQQDFAESDLGQPVDVPVLPGAAAGLFDRSRDEFIVLLLCKLVCIANLFANIISWPCLAVKGVLLLTFL